MTIDLFFYYLVFLKVDQGAFNTVIIINFCEGILTMCFSIMSGVKNKLVKKNLEKKL
jgi:hypothetical protein